MALQVHAIALELAASLPPLFARLKTQDPDLEDDMRRAAKSTPLNIAEGFRRTGRDRTHHYKIAAGSADEVRSALLVARAFGYLRATEVARSLELADRTCAMLWSIAQVAGNDWSEVVRLAV